MTPIDHDGDHVAALVHDAALAYEPELLEIVCAAADVALERERLQAELESRVEELAGSRARLVAAGDEARRRIERDLHDGAQQRLVSLAIALRLTENRIREDPEAAVGLVPRRARRCPSRSPSCASSRADPSRRARARAGGGARLARHAVADAADRLVRPRRAAARGDRLAAYFVASEALANVGKYAQASRASIECSARIRSRSSSLG